MEKGKGGLKRQSNESWGKEVEWIRVGEDINEKELGKWGGAGKRGRGGRRRGRCGSGRRLGEEGSKRGRWWRRTHPGWSAWSYTFVKFLFNFRLNRRCVMTPPLLRPWFMKMKFASSTALVRYRCGDWRHDAVALFCVLELPGDERRRGQRRRERSWGEERGI